MLCGAGVRQCPSPRVLHSSASVPRLRNHLRRSQQKRNSHRKRKKEKRRQASGEGRTESRRHRRSSSNRNSSCGHAHRWDRACRTCFSVQPSARTWLPRTPLRRKLTATASLRRCGAACIWKSVRFVSSLIPPAIALLLCPLTVFFPLAVHRASEAGPDTLPPRDDRVCPCRAALRGPAQSPPCCTRTSTRCTRTTRAPTPGAQRHTGLGAAQRLIFSLSFSLSS